MKLSIIIPTLNEEQNIIQLLHHLLEASPSEPMEIIVCDGGSSDQTVATCRKMGVRILETLRGRAIQMNAGAIGAAADVFYFIHADTRPPRSYFEDILAAVQEGYDMGSYRFKFDSHRNLLKINSYFTRFNKMWSRGGDQSLFITKDAFRRLGGFQEEYVIMEEFDLLKRAQKLDMKFKVIPKDIIVSARKYDGNNYFRVQFANLVVFNMFRFGYEPQRILNMYRRLIDYRS